MSGCKPPGIRLDGVSEQVCDGSSEGIKQTIARTHHDHD